MKKYLYLLIIIFISCSAQEEVFDNNLEIENTDKEIEMNEEKVYTSVPEMNIDLNKKYTAVMKTNMGDISIEFFTNDAPLTVNNFINLSKDGYYNEVIFHRVINGFMIQGGDPSGTGHGEMGKYPGYKFEDELNNKQPYEKGILAMANAGPNTNGSQFFIMHVDYPLPYQYTIFGKVTDGLDIVDKIASVETAEGDRPVSDVVIESIEIKEN
jgi:cyclophilin family peptidyl-prolyl cis-trans isomerase